MHGGWGWEVLYIRFLGGVVTGTGFRFPVGIYSGHCCGAGTFHASTPATTMTTCCVPVHVLQELQCTLYDVESGECLWEHIETTLVENDIEMDEFWDRYEQVREWANSYRSRVDPDGSVWYPMPLSKEDLEGTSSIEDVVDALTDAHWFGFSMGL